MASIWVCEVPNKRWESGQFGDSPRGHSQGQSPYLATSLPQVRDIEGSQLLSNSVGLELESVNPWGTSRYCPRCGSRGETVKSPDDHTECRHGGHFHCPGCGYECDRDMVGAINVGRKCLSDSTMEEANPVAYMETGTHASFPSPAVTGETGARSTGVQSTAHSQQQDTAGSRQTQLTQYCPTATRGGLLAGGLLQNQSNNTGRQLPSGSIIPYVLANTG